MKRLLLLLAVSSAFSVFADPGKTTRLQGKDRKFYRKAQEYFFFEEYDRAVPLLRKLSEQYPQNSIIHFELGVCMYYSPTDKMKSLPFFEKALNLAGNKADDELLYYAGTSYQMVNRFDDAIRCFSELKKKMETPDGIKSVDRLIETCNNGKKMMEHPLNVRIENLGDNVNSPYPDYAPVLTSGEQFMLFTSKREGTTGGNIDDDGYYFEDVYMSRNVGNNKGWSNSGKYDSTYKMTRKGPLRFLFTKAENVAEINTHDHDGSIAVSPDGNDLYIFRYSDIWKATVNENGHWSKPKRLHETIDGKSTHEPSLCISHDGNSLYFVSDRPGGLGGKDIYRAARMPDGSWGTPVNLGPSVNTAYDEESPYLDAEGKYLYFASEGHNSMGGFDIFKSPLENDKPGQPENLGYPINNGGDDIFFVPGAKGDYAYYASMQNNTLGDLDIYAVEFLKDAHRLWVKLIDNAGERPISDASVWFTNRENGRKNLLEVAPDGTAQFNFEPGASYTLSVDREGYHSAKAELHFPDDAKLDNCYQEIRFEFTKNESGAVNGQAITLTSGLFDVDKEIGRNGSGDMNAARSGYLASLDKANPRAGLVVNKVQETYDNSPTGPATVVFNTIYFEFEKSDLGEEARVELDRAADYMKRHPAVQFELYGYTDSKGSESFNTGLSQKRAESVKNYLLGKGVSAQQLHTIPKGMSDPVGLNDSEAGRRKNRRVEIRIKQ